MADYWKSQDKKFCDFCKCWITDNKPSVDFHENGRRHKENVKKRISQISRKSAKDQRDQAKMDTEIRKMEAAAMKSYMNDVHKNPDYTSAQYVKQAEEAAAAAAAAAASSTRGSNFTSKKTEFEDPLLKPYQRLHEIQQQNKQKKKEKKIKEKTKVKVKKKFWYEQMSADGRLYYYHCETNERSWQKPDEDYYSMDEQKLAAEAHLLPHDTGESLEEERLRKIAGSEEEIKAWRMREMMKVINIEPEEQPKFEMSGPILEPVFKPQPYGKWTVIKQVKQEAPPPIVDLQLPKQEYVPISVPKVSEPRMKIKEKKVTSLEEEDGPSSFKKRKPNPRKMNIRRRASDDDE